MAQTKTFIDFLRLFVMALVCMAALAGAVFVAGSFLPGIKTRTQLVKKPDPLMVQGLLSEAGQAEENNRWPEVIAAYEKILQEDPAFLAAHLKLGMIYFHIGLPSRAEEQYLLALDKGINDPDVYLHLGYIKESQEKFAEALDYYSKAELAGSRNPVVYFNMGNVHARQGKMDKALEYFKRAVVLNPGYMDAFVNLSIISAQAGEYSDALYYLEKAEKLGYQAPDQFKKGLEEKIKK